MKCGPNVVEKNVLNFDIGDTNHIENKNREIKLHFQSKFPSMLDCIQNLLVFRDLHQNRTDFKDFRNRMTVSRLVQNSESEIVKLAHAFCTKTAADLIIHQHLIAEELVVTDVKDEEDDDFVISFEDADDAVAVSKNFMCSCNWYKRYHLPCCHVIALRLCLHVPAISRDIIHNRWKKIFRQL